MLLHLQALVESITKNVIHLLFPVFRGQSYSCDLKNFHGYLTLKKIIMVQNIMVHKFMVLRFK